MLRPEELGGPEVWVHRNFPVDVDGKRVRSRIRSVKESTLTEVLAASVGALSVATLSSAAKGAVAGRASGFDRKTP
ncbi:MAG: hypothetical protein AAGA95_11075, partial [Pseudomonadota bacterium]